MQETLLYKSWKMQNSFAIIQAMFTKNVSKTHSPVFVFVISHEKKAINMTTTFFIFRENVAINKCFCAFFYSSPHVSVSFARSLLSHVWRCAVR